jgi:hypothetical protein
MWARGFARTFESVSLQAYIVQQELDRRAELVRRADAGRSETRVVRRRRRWSAAGLGALIGRRPRVSLPDTLEPGT